MTTREPTHAQQLAELQGWRCYLCGGLMCREYRPGEATWASLDHVIPLCRGGTWDADNLVAMHRHCNTWKRSALMEEITDENGKVLWTTRGNASVDTYKATG